MCFVKMANQMVGPLPNAWERALVLEASLVGQYGERENQGEREMFFWECLGGVKIF